MNKLKIIICGAYGIKPNVEILVTFKEDSEFNKLLEKKNTTAMTFEEYDIFEKYTRNILVLIGLVNYTEYVIFAGNKKLYFRSSKKVRFNLIDITDISDVEYNKRYKRLDTQRRYTIKLVENG